MTAQDQDGSERRRVERKPLLQQFYLAATLPDTRPFRLKVVDVSERGIGFAYSMEEIESWALQAGDVAPLHLYLNQRLYIPLKIRIVQLRPSGREVSAGAEILKEESEGYDALIAFLRLLDAFPKSVKEKLRVL